MGSEGDIALLDEALEGARVSVIRFVHVLGAKIAARIPAAQFAHHTGILQLAIVGRRQGTRHTGGGEEFT